MLSVPSHPAFDDAEALNATLLKMAARFTCSRERQRYLAKRTIATMLADIDVLDGMLIGRALFFQMHRVVKADSQARTNSKASSAPISEPKQDLRQPQ